MQEDRAIATTTTRKRAAAAAGSKPKAATTKKTAKPKAKAARPGSAKSKPGTAKAKVAPRAAAKPARTAAAKSKPRVAKTRTVTTAVTKAAQASARPKAPKAPASPKKSSIPAEVQKLHQLILASLDDDKAEQVVSIDLTGKSSIADYLVVASGRSSRQVAAIAEHLIEKITRATGRKVRAEGKAVGDWVLIDTGDIVVHLFRPEIRSFYNLEKMWGGAALPEPAAA